MAVEHAAGARLDGESPPQSETCDSARAFDARRILGERVLLRPDLQAQPPPVTVDADVRLSGAYQRHAVNERGRDIVRGPGAAKNVPLKHHALAAEIDH